MKTYSFSKNEIDYLQPLDAVLNGINVAVQVFVVNTVYKRLGLPADTKARYDLQKGELYQLEEVDLNPPKGTGTPEPHAEAEKKVEEKPVDNKPVSN